jgi:hypothetical protein
MHSVYSPVPARDPRAGLFAAFAFLVQEGGFGPAPEGVDEIDVNVRLSTGLSTPSRIPESRMLPGISRFRLFHFGFYQCTGTALRPLAGGFTAAAIPLTGTVRFFA